MQATKFEFEKRLWIILAIYFIGFSLSSFDPMPMTGALRHWLAPSIPAGSREALLFARCAIFLGALLVFLAAAIRTWGAAYLRTAVVHDTSQHSESLVAEGPFRYTRNPLYLAGLPMAAGVGVLASRLGFVFLVLAHWIFFYRLIFREETALRERQGESYLAYCRAVPRFWPSLVPRVPSGNQPPQWGQAFAGESFVWLFGFAELAIALTLQPAVGWILFPVAILVHIVFRRRILEAKTQPDAA
jgi:protein-S-isoprenylcysteine O-methyltransferase Ste14